MKIYKLFLYFLFINISCTSFSAEMTFERPFQVAGLEKEIKVLADICRADEAALSSLLPSNLFASTRKMKWLRFDEGLTDKFGFFYPHPRSIQDLQAEKPYPQTDVTALLLQLFPAATGVDEFTPNRQPNDPVGNLKPERIGKLIRLINDFIEKYIPAVPLMWRLELEEKIYDILTRRDQSLIEEIDPDDFYRRSLADTYAKTLRKLFSEADIDEDDEFHMAAKAAMESDCPLTNILKLPDADFFAKSPWEEGELEELERKEWPYTKRQEYALKKEYFVNLLVNAIENQALQGTESSIQEALAVYFYAQRPNKADVESFYGGYFGLKHLELRPLNSPGIFSEDDYDAYKTAARRFPKEMHFLNLPYDVALNVAYTHTNSGVFHTTPYGSIGLKRRLLY